MRFLLAIMSLTAAVPAAAHVAFVPGTATPGAEYIGVVWVGHGCAGSPTIALEVAFPSPLHVEAPPKTGWTIERRTVPGKPWPSEVITWRGRLPAEQPGEFPIRLQAPAMTGPQFFPTIQTCADGQVRWADLPHGRQSPHALKTPAPVLVFTADKPTNRTPAPATGAAELPKEVKVVGGALRTASNLPLYTFNFDTMVGMSHCFGECVAKRPPLLAPANAKGEGDWTVIDRGEDTRQWAYKTKPLYTFTGDTPGGPATGVGPGSNWSVARY